MSDAQEPQAEQPDKKDPSLGDRAKKALKDEAVRTVAWEGRSLLYRILGHRLGRLISQIFGR